MEGYHIVLGVAVEGGLFQASDFGGLINVKRALGSLLFWELNVQKSSLDVGEALAD